MEILGGRISWNVERTFSSEWRVANSDSVGGNDLALFAFFMRYSLACFWRQ
ncbi:MAG TPA: hypothetical protein VGG01_19545 [Xanthobacteraceae bacterium]|jgi:hypothetical protein